MRLRQLRGDQESITRVAAEWKALLTALPDANRSRLRAVLEEHDVFYKLGRARVASEVDQVQELSHVHLPWRFAEVVQHLTNALRRALAADEPPSYRLFPSFKDQFESILVDYLPLIDKVVTMYARKYHVQRDDIDDLASTVKLALVENDYAILRKFEGRSSLATYLYTVIKRLMLASLARQWGRWRPSARARQIGEDAIWFERLVWRDGYSIDEALGMVASSRAISTADLENLYGLLSRVPRPVFVPRPEEIADNKPLHPDVLITDEVQRSLSAVINLLPKGDRELLVMRFWNETPIREIASALSLSEQATYKRLGRILRTLRRELDQAGVHPEEMNMFLAQAERRVHGLAAHERRRGDAAPIRLVQSLYERFE